MNMIEAHEMQEGSGVTVRRLFPFRRDILVADPFVLWDDFAIGAGAGFPTHAHRGFEAITYLFEGSMNHADNLGNNSTVMPGGAQRFTAGKGIRHSEMPGDQGATRGIQLWINLPRALKHVDPEYQQVDASDIPSNVHQGVTVRHIVGQPSPLQLRTEVIYQDISMKQDSDHAVAVAPNLQGLVYVHQGWVSINQNDVRSGQAALVDRGESLSIHANEGSRILLALGQPHNEPVYLNGGFVD